MPTTLKDVELDVDELERNKTNTKPIDELFDFARREVKFVLIHILII